MSRVQLALDVTDLSAAVEFYSKLFATPPAKLRAGYANFAVTDPPLKLILIEGPTGGTLNHLGVEVGTTEAVHQATERLRADGLATATEDAVECCFARQDKVWVDGPDGEPWEIYTVLADVERPAGQLRTAKPGEDTGGCGTPAPASTADSARSTCCAPAGGAVEPGPGAAGCCAPSSTAAAALGCR